MERINTRKRKTMNIVQSWKCYLSDTNPLVIPMIFIFLSCRKKAHDNKEFGREVSKLRCESRAVKKNPGVNKWQNWITN